ncbi:MAG TPA: M10 family metallopeptidase C-terminal domain-containing protein, partial [Ramlibacter sp.]|nr:M10 family metallopeptidase C-terminal domain-containing protein [Ramlibacter sp.]
INAGGYAFFPSSVAMGGDIWIGAAQAAAQWDFYRPNLILHETLHAIGLNHPFSTGAVLSPQENIIPNTVMSYSPVAGGTSGFMTKYPNEPMPLDIAALQHLYGAAASNVNSTVYDLAAADFQGGFNAVWDAGGTDVFDASRVGRMVTLDLAENALSDVGVAIQATAKQNGVTIGATYTNTVSIAQGAVIENAIGTSFADRISGNAAANLLAGGAGNDLLEGRDGNDVLEGGAGLDTAVIAASRAGYGIAKAGNSYTVWGGATGTDSLTGIERITFNDARVALDLDGNAGTVAKILGAVLGASSAHNAVYAGLGLGALDGGMSAETLAQYAIAARLGAGASNSAVVKLLFNNIAGVTPADDYLASYVQLLDNGSFTQGGLAMAAAQHEMNLANIDLVGLAATGLEYIA